MESKETGPCRCCVLSGHGTLSVRRVWCGSMCLSGVLRCALGGLLFQHMAWEEPEQACRVPATPACPQARAAAEVRERLGGAAPSAANAGSLQYLEAVVLEALRLRPPAYLVGRCAARDVELGPYSLTAGAPPRGTG